MLPVTTNTTRTARQISAADLGQFTGSDEWMRHQSGMLYTSGVEFLAEHAGAYWLLDLIASHQPKARRNERLREIQFWELRVNDDNTAVVTCREDSGIPPAIRQRLEFTDFAKCGMTTVRLYVANNTILLPSEY